MLTGLWGPTGCWSGPPLLTWGLPAGGRQGLGQLTMATPTGPCPHGPTQRPLAQHPLDLCSDQRPFSGQPWLPPSVSACPPLGSSAHQLLLPSCLPVSPLSCPDRYPGSPAQPPATPISLRKTGVQDPLPSNCTARL